jgi:formate dehydrogenase major subunit
MKGIPREKGPLYRAPGSEKWEDIGWPEAVDLIARRLKDLRDRDLGMNPADKTPVPNRVNSLGIIAGGCLTNEEAYTMAKLFRCFGVFRMDTTVRSSHGMGVLGIMDTLGFPGATHPVTQISSSDVVMLMGCNPGQTAPAVSRLLDNVRQRRGTVIIIDTRRTETVRKDDLFLLIRPGTDAAVLGAFIKWILDRGELDVPDLVQHSDAPFIVLSQVMGEYQRYSSGKRKNQLVVDETLTEPYSVFQRLKTHFERYDLRKVAGITGLDIDLLRRACTLLARTVDTRFSASFVLGRGALGHHSGIQVVRMAAMIQSLLGNLDKKGGSIIFPADTGNAQGVCDMGLLAPYFPGYLDLTGEDPKVLESPDKEAFQALCRTWYPDVDFNKALGFLPHRQVSERHSLSTLIQGVEDGEIRSLITVGADPVSGLPGSAELPEAMTGLDLLVVLDHVPNGTSEFWKKGPLKEETIKTEVLFIPTETPASQDGSMTDSGRRVCTVRPIPGGDDTQPGLLNFLVDLGNAIKSKYSAEGGVLEDAVLNMNWPMLQDPESVAAEINGWQKEGSGREGLLHGGDHWKPGDQCGNRLYRGWMTEGKWLAGRKDPSDPHNMALFENWGWFWPRGIPDPFSWIRDRREREGVFLRWNGQEGDRVPSADLHPPGARPPIKFWMIVDTGTPFPEHYEPFYSPLHDLLTGGRSSPHLSLRTREKHDWGYLYRRPKELLDNFPVIVTNHRTGNLMGTGGLAAMVPHLRELGTCRIVEISPEFAGLLGVRSGDMVTISSPFWEEGIKAAAVVTARIGRFTKDPDHYHIASVTRYGEGDKGLNALTTPAFDNKTGGLETRTFMGKITKVERGK